MALRMFLLWTLLCLLPATLVLLLGVSLYASALIAKPRSERGEDWIGSRGHLD